MRIQFKRYYFKSIVNINYQNSFATSKYPFNIAAKSHGVYPASDEVLGLFVQAIKFLLSSLE